MLQAGKVIPGTPWSEMCLVVLFVVRCVARFRILRPGRPSRHVPVPGGCEAAATGTGPPPLRAAARSATRRGRGRPPRGRRTLPCDHRRARPRHRPQRARRERPPARGPPRRRAPPSAGDRRRGGGKGESPQDRGHAHGRHRPRRVRAVRVVGAPGRGRGGTRGAREPGAETRGRRAAAPCGRRTQRAPVTAPVTGAPVDGGRPRVRARCAGPEPGPGGRRSRRTPRPGHWRPGRRPRRRAGPRAPRWCPPPDSPARPGCGPRAAGAG